MPGYAGGGSQQRSVRECSIHCPNKPLPMACGFWSSFRGRSGRAGPALLSVGSAHCSDHGAQSRRLSVAKGIEHRDARRFEVPYVAGHHGQAMFEGRGSDQQVHAFVPEGPGLTSPPARSGDIHCENPVAVQCEHQVQPDHRLPRKRCVPALLLCNPPLYLPLGHRAQEQVLRLLALRPLRQFRMPHPPP